MAFDSVDSLIAGFQPPAFFGRQVTPATLGPLRVFGGTFSGSSIPGTGGGFSPGTAGEPMIGPALPGFLMKSNPPSGKEARLAKFAGFSSSSGMLWLVDRLWQNSGLAGSFTSTALTMSGGGIPARDDNGTTDGLGVLCGIEAQTSVGAGVPTTTLTYTNSDGTSGRTSTITIPGASAAAGTIDLFPLASGDKGIRSVENIAQSSTRTSGTLGLVLYRVLAVLDLQSAIPASIDAISSGLPRIYDDSCLQLFWNPQSTSAQTYYGSIAEVWG